MKDLFATLACVLLAGFAVARAEDVTVGVWNGDVEYQSIETTLERNSEGVYSLAKFVNTKTPLEFKFDETIAVGEKTPVEIMGNYKVVYDYYYRIKNTSDKYPQGKLYDGNGEEVLVRYPCVYTDGSTNYAYVEHLDKAEEGYDYVCALLITGIDANDQWLDYYDYYFYFNELTDSGVSDVINDSAVPAQYYGIDGRRVENPGKGFYIRRQGSDVKKVLLR